MTRLEIAATIMTATALVLGVFMFVLRKPDTTLEQRRGAATQSAITEAASPAARGVFVIHSGSCPTGWTSRRGLFKEQDGTTEDGCFVVRTLDGPGAEVRVRVDVLKAGENMDLPITLALPAPAAKGGRS